MFNFFILPWVFTQIQHRIALFCRFLFVYEFVCSLLALCSLNYPLYFWFITFMTFQWILLLWRHVLFNINCNVYISYRGMSFSISGMSTRSKIWSFSHFCFLLLTLFWKLNWIVSGIPHEVFGINFCGCILYHFSNGRWVGTNLESKNIASLKNNANESIYHPSTILELHLIKELNWFPESESEWRYISHIPIQYIRIC